MTSERPPLVIVLEDERCPSWNGMYAGMHHAKRTVLAKSTHLKVLAAMPEDVEMFDRVVDIHIVAQYKGNRADSDNVVAKIYIDGLKNRVIVDDDGRWVRRVTTEACKGSTNRVTIIVTPAEESC